MLEAGGAEPGQERFLACETSLPGLRGLQRKALDRHSA